MKLKPTRISNSSVLLVGVFFNKIFSNLRSRCTTSIRTRNESYSIQERINKCRLNPFYEDNIKH
jgi:hypothetical protein